MARTIYGNRTGRAAWGESIERLDLPRYAWTIQEEANQYRALMEEQIALAIGYRHARRDWALAYLRAAKLNRQRIRELEGECRPVTLGAQAGTALLGEPQGQTATGDGHLRIE